MTLDDVNTFVADNFIYYESFMYATDPLSDEDFGCLMRSLQNYAFKRIEPESFKNDHIKSIYELIIPQIRASQRNYLNGKRGGRPRKVIEEIKKGGINGGNNQQEQEYKYNQEYKYKYKQGEGFTETANADPTPSRKSFVKPTIDEINDYIKEKSFSFSAEGFFNYYESCGWRVSDKKKMSDWKAACRRWQMNEEKWHNNDKPDVDKAAGKSVEIDWEEIKKRGA